MLAKEQNEIQELINTAIGEGKSLEEVEKQIGMSFIQVGDPDEVKKQWEQAKKEQDSNQRTLEDKIKGRGLYPYDLSGVEKITQKAIRQIEKTPQNKLSIAHDAIQEIDKIIRNAESVYKMLVEEGSIEDIDVHDHFHNELNKAIEQKRQFKEEIDTLNLNAAKQAESNVKVENNKEISKVEPENSGNSQEPKETSSVVKTSNSEQKSYPERMGVEEVAEYIGKSTSWVYKKVGKRLIPFIKVGAADRFITSEIDTWLKTKKMPERYNSQEVPEKKANKKYRFSFGEHLLAFTNAFVEKGYLDEKNAKMFSERFKSCFLINDLPKIEWGDKKITSLMTFILISQKLELLDADASDQRQNPTFGDPSILLEPFFSNFNSKKGWSGASISRNMKKIMTILDNIENKAKSFNKKELPFKESLDLFLNNKITVEIKNNTIDLEMLKIMQTCSQPKTKKNL